MGWIKQQLQEQIDALKVDICNNHLPRLEKAMNADYPDENQALIVYDHMVRIRNLQEILDAYFNEL